MHLQQETPPPDGGGSPVEVKPDPLSSQVGDILGPGALPQVDVRLYEASRRENRQAQHTIPLVAGGKERGKGCLSHVEAAIEYALKGSIVAFVLVQLEFDSARSDASLKNRPMIRSVVTDR